MVIYTEVHAIKQEYYLARDISTIDKASLGSVQIN